MKVLLIEPAYKNKYPPIGLMKIATYHKMRGDDVTFYKGDIKQLIINTLTNTCIEQWMRTHPEHPKHNIPTQPIKEYIYKGYSRALQTILTHTDNADLIQKIKHTRQSYTSKQYLIDLSWKWDRVYVTTLFTFYWNKIILTINQAKQLTKTPEGLLVGGITATLLQQEMMAETQLASHNFLTGMLDKPGMADPGDPTIIDHLQLDYNILNEIDYQYKEHGNYYGYMTRGCVRRCPFCIVSIIEPKYVKYIPFAEKLEQVKNEYGDQKHLLLLDNNVMASSSFKQIIQEILDAGFHKGAHFTTPDYLTLNIQHIKQGKIDKGRIIKTAKLLLSYLQTNQESETKEHLIALYTQHNLFVNFAHILPSPADLISVYEAIEIQYLKTLKPQKSLRYVDFNQGVDARLITDEKMQLLSKIAIKPLRIAFDSWEMEPVYTKAVQTATKHGIRHLSNYLLYNFKDKPEELYYRMRHNVELGKELGVSIFSFPMKFHPVTDINYFSNRTYMGEHWNRKYIRAIQLVLNATKGKTSPNPSFFYHAFGETEDEFKKILLMPDEYILYRGKNTQNGNIKQWWNDYSLLSDEDREQANVIIHTNSFSPEQWVHYQPAVQTLLAHYVKS